MPGPVMPQPGMQPVDFQRLDAQRVDALKVDYRGLVDYEATWQAMQHFTASRGDDTPDELWLLEHPPVYTQGQAGKPEHVRHTGDIPLVRTDRGGQVTYHGPGQLVAYVLLDLHRRHLGVRELVRRLEQSLIDLLAEYGIHAHGRVDAPGVYVDAAKIASLGLRIRKGRSYHGLALNVAMDLEPFAGINPCGFPALAVTQLRDFGIHETPASLAPRLAEKIGQILASPGQASVREFSLDTAPAASAPAAE